MAIRTQRFLYHLTSVANVPSIFQRGLLPRSLLEEEDFADIADAEIILGRSQQGLERFVPFHWFAKNPFDGRVYQDRSDEEFVLVAVERSHAQRNDWNVIARHPLSGARFELLGYDEGVDMIDWDLMDLRDYHDPECKHVCMAECLSPGPVSVTHFAKIFTPSEEISCYVRSQAEAAGLGGLWIDANRNMFPAR
ncbi:TPA: DarT ssDNA thymidine ADP-ribosyltransferase family protein [Pseudomonas putida]